MMLDDPSGRVDLFDNARDLFMLGCFVLVGGFYLSVESIRIPRIPRILSIVVHLQQASKTCLSRHCFGFMYILCFICGICGICVVVLQINASWVEVVLTFVLTLQTRN